MRTLVYCGTNMCSDFIELINSGEYDMCYGFEAHPTLYNRAKKIFNNMNNVEMYNVILGEEHDTIKEFFIQDPNHSGCDFASSTGKITEEYGKVSGNEIKLKDTVNIKTMNLYKFLQEKNISEIDFLLTDLEGSDLDVIKTLKPMIETKSIKKIQCEVEPDKMPIKYDGLDNKFSGFDNILKENYRLTWIDPIAEENWFSIDHRWELK
tara:strand:- start:48 stop:671 length:624 start_codon:yes stop_codon:yes gene_type:complete